jgi:hypothetical protein
MGECKDTAILSRLLSPLPQGVPGMRQRRQGE